ncbi:MAG: hypothetical protein CMD92_03745 [Gammaproteobacteria bacterium]|nr:hypothetical protein [Gammaproteobacteria bacterium]
MDSEELLAQLADIHLPAEISFWPPAPGWWILGALFLATASIIAKKLYDRAEQRKAYRYALTELESCLERLSNTQTDGEGKLLRYVNDVNTVLRRVALVKFPESGVGSLAGESWVAFIRRTGDSSLLNDQVSAALAHGRFRRHIELDSQTLHQVAYNWIRSVYQPRKTQKVLPFVVKGSSQ